MPSKDLVYRIGMDLGDLDRQTDSAITKTRAWQKELRTLEQQQRQHRAALTDLGRGMVAFGTATLIGLALSAKAAIDWESAFAGVRKTVDGSDVEIAALEGELRQLAKTLPATHEEIAGVAEAAGQLGIKRKDIAEFTKTMIDLGETTNLSAEEAATALAKFANIMGTSASDVDRLGSALVALGNDGASTEQDIIAMGLRIAAAGRQVGLTESQVLGFASALSSVGIEAEAGGSAFSTAMIKMAVAARNGGEELDLFAKVAGLSAGEFTKKFSQDAAGAIILFIQGLARMQQQGGDTFGTLESLGLSEIRVRDAMLRAAGASDMFTSSLQTGSQAWLENTALADEAAKRYETTKARMQVAGNQIKDAMIDIGGAILPAVAAGTQGISDMVRAFSELPGPLKTVVTVAGAAAAGITLVGGAALIAYPKILAFREGMRSLVATAGTAGAAVGKFGLFMSGPWGFAIGAAVTLLGAFAAGSGAASRKQQELAEAGRTVADVIREQNGVLNESVRQSAAKAAAEKGLLGQAKGLGIELPRVTDAILQQGTAYDQLIAELDRAVEAGTTMSVTGQGATITLSAEAQAALDLKNGLSDLVGGKNEQLQKTVDVTEATEESTTAAREQADAVAEQKRQADEATAALEKMVKALDSLNNITLNARQAHRAFLESIESANEALQKNGQNLDINTKAGRTNLDALDGVAQAANRVAEAAAKEAESTGDANAGMAALQASLEASRPELIKMAMAFGMSEREAINYTDSVLSNVAAHQALIPSARQVQLELHRVRDAVVGIPPGKTINVGVLSAEAKAKLLDLGFTVRTLPDGTVEVFANTGAAQGALNELVRRNTGRTINMQVVLTAYGPSLRTAAGTLLQAHGGIVAFAHGGMEDHSPLIAQAKPGTVRMWAEPDTGRESYIPWAMDRRARATQVLAATARGFGYELSRPARPAWQVQAQSTVTRTVDASTTIHSLTVADWREFERERRLAEQHRLFSAGAL